MLQYLHPDGRLPVQQRALLSEVPGKGSDLHLQDPGGNASRWLQAL